MEGEEERLPYLGNSDFFAWQTIPLQDGPPQEDKIDDQEVPFVPSQFLFDLQGTFAYPHFLLLWSHLTTTLSLRIWDNRMLKMVLSSPLLSPPPDLDQEFDEDLPVLVPIEEADLPRLNLLPETPEAEPQSDSDVRRTRSPRQL